MGWLEHLHVVVASSLSTIPGANAFQADGTLTYSLPLLAARPWCHGVHRLARSPPRHASEQLLQYCIRGYAQTAR